VSLVAGDVAAVVVNGRPTLQPDVVEGLGAVVSLGLVRPMASQAILPRALPRVSVRKRPTAVLPTVSFRSNFAGRNPVLANWLIHFELVGKAEICADFLPGLLPQMPDLHHYLCGSFHVASLGEPIIIACGGTFLGKDNLDRPQQPHVLVD